MRLLFLRLDRKTDAILEKLEKAAEETKAKLAKLEK